MSINSNVDILKKVADIERLKCNLLSGVSAFFEAVANGEHGIDDLCCVLENCYFLASHHGLCFDSLDKRLAEKLRLSILENDVNEADKLKKDLLKHIIRK